MNCEACKDFDNKITEATHKQKIRKIIVLDCNFICDNNCLDHTTVGDVYINLCDLHYYALLHHNKEIKTMIASLPKF